MANFINHYYSVKNRQSGEVLVFDAILHSGLVPKYMDRLKKLCPWDLSECDVNYITSSSDGGLEYYSDRDGIDYSQSFRLFSDSVTAELMGLSDDDFKALFPDY